MSTKRDFARDWLSDPLIQSLTLEQQGAHFRLLCLFWAGGPIPGDRIARLLGISPAKASDLWGGDVGQFWSTGSDGLCSPIDGDGGEESAKSERMANLARARWAMRKDASGCGQNQEKNAIGDAPAYAARNAAPHAESDAQRNADSHQESDAARTPQKREQKREVSQPAKVSSLSTEREGSHSLESARARDLVADVAKARRAP